MKYKAYKYRIYPTKEQEVLIAKHLGCCRFMYNYALDKKIKAYRNDKTNISRYTIQAELPKMKKIEEYCWLSEVNSLSLQAALANLDSAFVKFFREKKGFPKFKSKKDNRQSFSVPQNTRVKFDESKQAIDDINSIFNGFLSIMKAEMRSIDKDRMKEDIIQEVIRKYSSPIALIPMWTEEDNIMIDDIISDARQHADLDSEQIEYLKNLKDRNNKLIKTLNKE